MFHEENGEEENKEERQRQTRNTRVATRVQLAQIAVSVALRESPPMERNPRDPSVPTESQNSLLSRGQITTSRRSIETTTTWNGASTYDKALLKR